MVNWICNDCHHSWEPRGEGSPEGCPKCKSKNIEMFFDNRTLVLGILKAASVREGAELLTDLILEDPDNVEHVWECLSDHGVPKGQRRSIMKAIYKKTRKQLQLDKLERGEALKEKQSSKTPDEDMTEQIDERKRQVKELDRTMELQLLDQQYQMKLRQMQQMTGLNINPVQNQLAPNPYAMPMMEIQKQEGWLDEDQKQPNIVIYKVPYNPMMQYGMPGMQPQGQQCGQSQQPPKDPMEIATEAVALVEKGMAITRENQPQTGSKPEDVKELKELKDEVKKLEQELNAKELKAVEANWEHKLKTEIDKLKVDQGTKSKEQIEAETGKEFIKGTMECIKEQQSSHNKKMELVLDKGFNLLAKKMGGKDELVSKGDLIDEPPAGAVAPPPPPPPASMAVETTDTRRPPPGRR